MAWYVVVTVNPAPGSSGISRAAVQQFANAAAYEKTVGASPRQVDAKQPVSGYATQAQAQREANRWNGQPTSQKLTGTLPNPNADTVLPPNFKLPDILGGLNLGSWFLRIGEGLLGLVLIGVGIARVTGAQNVISQAVKTKLPIPL